MSTGKEEVLFNILDPVGTKIYRFKLSQNKLSLEWGKMNHKSNEVLRQPSKRRCKQREVSALETDQLSSKKGSHSLWHQSTALFQEIPSNTTELLCAQPSPRNHLGHLSWQCLNLCIWKMAAGEGWGEALNSEIHIYPLT